MGFWGFVCVSVCVCVCAFFFFSYLTEGGGGVSTASARVKCFSLIWGRGLVGGVEVGVSTFCLQGTNAFFSLFFTELAGGGGDEGGRRC